MRRRVLQDLANALCQMAVAARLGEDYERLAAMPDGAFRLDLQNRTATSSAGARVELAITDELAEWLERRLKSEAVLMAALVSAQVELEFRTDRVKTDRKKIVSFDLSCSSSLKTSEVEYVGVPAKRHAYHQRRVA